ncbi:MAG: hypothetical protein Q4F31_10215 [Eubacteriales bacterium]|nr:hypothetical protein [Eubacteriales bacterium]
MKKLLAMITVLALVLSFGAAGFADSGDSTVEVKAGTGSVEVTTGSGTETISAGSETQTKTYSNVTNIGASGGVEAGITGNIQASSGTPVEANNSTVVITGDVTKSTPPAAEDPVYTAVLANDSKVTVQGNVKNESGNPAVVAVVGSTVEIDKDISSTGSSVLAQSSSSVTVNGSAESTNGSTIIANSGSSIHAGSVTANGENGAAAHASGGTITVDGDAKAHGENSAAAYAEGSGAIVTVTGNALSDANGNFSIAVQGMNGGTVKVGGNVEATGDSGQAVQVFGGTVLVEGSVTGSVTVFDGSTSATSGSSNFRSTLVWDEVNKGCENLTPTSSGTPSSDGGVYLGMLNGTIAMGPDQVHYLIGTDTEKSSGKLDQDVSISGSIGNGTVTGAEKNGVSKTYYYTDSADLSKNMTITLTPKDGSKKLTVSGLPAGVTSSEADGKVILTLGNDFKGGLQSLMLTLQKIAIDNPNASADIVINADVIPALFVDSSFAVATISVELPEGAEEGAAQPVDIPNHAGIKVAPSLLSKTAEYHMVQMFLDDSPVPENVYSITNHGDGSVTIQMSNTYLLSLGSGTYNFRALVDGQEIFFTVLVAK